MESDDLGGELVRLDNGYLVTDEAFVESAEDVIDQEENNSDSNSGRHAPLREQDRFLPIANIAKIMKRAIPDNGKIAKDARECVQECISEFISFITSEASDRCQVEKRKTINGEDVLFAMNTLGFENYVEPLKAYLKKYRELVLNPMSHQNQGGLDEKRNKPILMYEAVQDNDNNDGEIQQEIHSEGTTVIYTYPKGISDFNI